MLTATGGGVSYYWTSYPTDPTLLIPQQQNPVVSPQVSTMYVVQSNIATGNLILNGSFELGVVGFSSDYVNNQTSIIAEGTYAVVNDAHTVHPNFFCNQDHTSGAGKMMCVNGSGVQNVRVWYHTLTNVQPNTRYEFSTWITSLHETNPAKLQFSINGQLMGQPFQAYSSTCDWYQFFHVWESGENNQATISIVNQNTILSGNDFALDDISFATVIVYYDTVWVEVIPVYSSAFTANLQAFIYETIMVEYTGNAPDTAVFHWDFGDAVILSGSGPGPYEIMFNSPGAREISLWIGEDCPSAFTTLEITIDDSPLGVFVIADPETLCPGGQAVLSAQGYGGTENYSYAWTSDPPGFNSTLPVVTVSPEVNTIFHVTVNDGMNAATSSATVSIHSIPLANAGEDQSILHGTSTWLNGAVTGGSGLYQYQWEPASLLVNPSSVSTQTFNLTTPTVFSLYVTDQVTGCAGLHDEVIVFIEGGPLAVIINPGNLSLCKGDTALLTAYASGGDPAGYAYAWTDNFGNTYPPQQHISVAPVETTTYIVTVNDGYSLSSGSMVLTMLPSAEFKLNILQETYFTCPYDSVELYPDPAPPDWNYLWSNGASQSHVWISTTGIGFNQQELTLTATNTAGCSYSRDIVVIFDFSYCSGLEENTRSPEFVIAPNPSRGSFRVIRHDSGYSADLKVFHPVHGLVFEKSLEERMLETEVSLAGLPPGMYLVCLEGKGSRVLDKLLYLP